MQLKPVTSEQKSRSLPIWGFVVASPFDWGSNSPIYGSSTKRHDSFLGVTVSTHLF